MALNIDATFEEKLTYTLKRDMRNLANFHQSIQSRKYMSLKFTGEFCVMTIKNDTKFAEELTCQFKIDMRNSTNFVLSIRISKKFAL